MGVTLVSQPTGPGSHGTGLMDQLLSIQTGGEVKEGLEEMQVERQLLFS